MYTARTPFFQLPYVKKKAFNFSSILIFVAASQNKSKLQLSETRTSLGLKFVLQMTPAAFRRTSFQ